MFPRGSKTPADLDRFDPPYYPPSLTGLRGSHPGANSHAHDRALAKRSDWGTTTELSESYDLLVVGGGISGLSAAYLYLQKHGEDKKVLILDNHDDFGGHAKRNEHTVGGKTLISYAGALLSSDGQIVNLDLTDPTLGLWFNFLQGPAWGPLTSVSIPFSLSSATAVSAQMIVVAPSSMSGIALSQPVRLIVQ